MPIDLQEKEKERKAASDQWKENLNETRINRISIKGPIRAGQATKPQSHIAPAGNHGMMERRYHIRCFKAWIQVIALPYWTRAMRKHCSQGQDITTKNRKY